MDVIGPGLSFRRALGYARPSSGYDPALALGSDLLEMWDPDRLDLLSITGGMVSSWRGVKTGADLAQPTGTFQPAWAPTFNGAPCIIPDGLDDFLQLAPHPFWTGAAGGEIWAVCSQDAPPADTTVRTLVALGAGSAGGRVISRIVASGVNRLRVQTGDGSSALTRNGTIGDFSTRHVVRHIVLPTAQDGELDGVNDPTGGAVVSNTSNTRLRVFAFTNTGATLFWQGKLRKLLFTNPLSADKASALRTWLLSERKL